MHKQIAKEVLSRIKPMGSKPEEVEGMLKRIDSLLKKKGIRAKANLGGSFSKDTWLAGDFDVDIFVAFDLKYKDSDLSEMLAKAIAPLKCERVHGSRDYFIKKNDFTFEIIPVLKIKKDSDAQNVTDFSLRHVSWVNTRSKKLKDDIRLTKKFCKAAGCYGAESYIRGFSGHVVDLLVIAHNGFLPLLRAASKWKPKTVIDIPKKYRGKALLILNKSKTEGPLVVIDPVQPDRNAAASVTQERYDLFIKAAKAYLKKPRLDAFSVKKPDMAKLARKGKLTIIEAGGTEGSDDVVGTKLMKVYEHCLKALQNAGFKILVNGWDFDKLTASANMWFVTKESKLPEKMEVLGPPAKMKQHANEFKRKHGNAKVRKGRMVATVKRKNRTPLDTIKTALKDERIRGKAVRIKVR